MESNVPAELVDACRSGTAVLFVGSGASAASGLPTWEQLMSYLRRDLPPFPETDLLTIARYYELAHGRHRLITVISQALKGGAPSSVHQQIVRMKPQLIFTTNFDTLLEEAFKNATKPVGLVVSDEEVPYVYNHQHSIVKLHGSIDRPSSIVFTSRDYEQYEDSHPAIARILALHLQAKTVLLIGYSARDPDFRILLTRLHGETGSHSRKIFMVSFTPSRLERMELESRGISLIDLGPFNPDSAAERVAAILTDLTDLTGHPSPPNTNTEVVRTRIDRTRRLIAAAVEFKRRASPESEVVRLRQGYSTLSLGKNDHADSAPYSALLWKERMAYWDLLRAGFETRLIVGRRPIFSSDLQDRSPQDVSLARRLKGRCERLIKLIADAPGLNFRLAAVCSSEAHFADVALGSRSLFRGLRSDSNSGYSVTTITTDGREVRSFCERFDDSFMALTADPQFDFRDIIKVRELNCSTVALLKKSLAVLDTWLANVEE